MKKLTTKALALMLALMFVLSACGGNTSSTGDTDPASTPAANEPAEQGGGNEAEPVASVDGISEDAVLRVALSAEPEALIPLYTESKVSSSVNMALYDTLVYWNVEKAQAEPRIAKSWEWEEDEDGNVTRLVFNLRDDVYTTGGQQITAEDVVFSFEIAGTGSNSSIVSFLDVDNFEIIDDFTVVLKTYSPYPTLMDRIGNDMYAIVSKEAVEAKGGVEAALRDPSGIGTGKYVFENWVDDQYITITRNDDYWDQDALPYYKQIVYSFISDTASRAMAVESGDVDIAAEVQASQVPALEGNSDLVVDIYNMTTNRTFYMNTSVEPLDNPLVREAIFYLLNADAVITIANGSYGYKSETNFSTFNPYYVAPGADYVREVNVDKAKELLAEAGYADGFSMEFMTVPTSSAVAEIVKENLALGGIEVEVSLLEIGTYLGRLMNGEYDCYIGSSDNWDAANLVRQVDGRVPTQAAMGGAQYVNSDLSELIDRAYTSFDDTERYAAYAEIQEHIRDNFVCIGLCNEVRIECYTADITGIEYDQRGYAIYMNMRPAA